MGKRWDALPIRDRLKITSQSTPKVEDDDIGPGDIKPGAVPIVLHRDATDANADSTSEGKDINSGLNEAEERCLRSLAFAEMGNRYLDVRDALYDTNRWFTDRTDYQAWARRGGDAPPQHSVFWIKGNPGTGKSTLMKQLVRSFEDSPNHVMAHFFFNARGAPLERSGEGLFRALIHTLFKVQPNTRYIVMERYKNKQKTISPDFDWHRRELEGMLRSMITSQGWLPTTIFIDALDECDIDDMEDLVEMFIELSKRQPHFRLCVSSRHYHNIRIPSYYSVWVELENSQDIALYVEQRLADDDGEKDPSPKIAALKDEIVKKACGVFLWVKLVIQKLKRGRKTLKQMREILSSVPSDLSSIYYDLIKVDDEDESKRMWQVITLVLFAKRPLNLEEFRYALGFSTDEKYTSQNAFVESDDYLDGDDELEEYIRHTSRGLIEVTSGIKKDSDMLSDIHSDMSSDIYNPEDTQVEVSTLGMQQVQVIHESVRDFFLAELALSNFPYTFGKIDAFSGHELFVRACIHYLSIAELCNMFSDALTLIDPEEDEDTNWVRTKEVVDEDELRPYHFLPYCEESLFFHMANSDRSGISQGRLLDVLDGPNEDIFKPLHENDFPFAQATLFNLWRFFKAHDFEEETIEVTLPVEPFHMDLVAVLDINIVHTVAKHGVLSLIKKSVERGLPHSASKVYDEALAIAAACGHTNIVEYLLTIGVNIDTGENWTALHWAVARVHPETVQLLLDRGANVKIDDCAGRTPFEIGLLQYGLSIDVLKRLYHPVDVETAAEWMILALQHGSERTIRFLLNYSRGLRITPTMFKASFERQNEDRREIICLLMNSERSLTMTEDILCHAQVHLSREDLLFLLGLDQQLHISERVILTSLKTGYFDIFLEQDMIDITENMLAEAAKTPKYLRQVLDRYGTLQMSEIVLLEAARTSHESLELVLHRSPLLQITDEVLIAAAQTSCESLELVLDRNPPLQITDDVLIAAASAAPFPSYSSTGEARELSANNWTLIYLLERDSSLQITDRVLLAAASPRNDKALQCLLARKNMPQIPHNVVVASILSRDPYSEEFKNEVNRTPITKDILLAVAKSGNFDRFEVVLKRAQPQEFTQEVFEIMLENMSFPRDYPTQVLAEYKHLKVTEVVLRAVVRVTEWLNDLAETFMTIETLMEHNGRLRTEVTEEFLALLAAGGHLDVLESLKNAGHPSMSMENWIIMAKLDNMCSGHGPELSPRKLKELFAAKSLPLNIRDSQGRTLLWKVCSKGRRKIVSLLLENGADPRIPAFDGRTPLGTAIVDSNYGVIFTLQDYRGVELDDHEAAKVEEEIID